MDSREGLEEIWRNRVREAKLRLDFANNYVKEVQRDFMDDNSSDGHYAFLHAIRAETFALAEYRRTLRIYTELVMEGKFPDEAATA